MKYLLTVFILILSTGTFAQSKQKQKPVADTAKYDVTIKDSLGIVAYIEKDSSKLTVVHGERAAYAIFDEYKKIAVQSNLMAQELQLLRTIVSMISVTSGQIGNPDAFRELIKKYLDFQSKTK